MLVIQQEEKRKFDEFEEAFLATVSAHLAGIIAHAEVTGEIAALFNAKVKPEFRREICLEGIPSSPGVGSGKVVVVYPPADFEAVPSKQIDMEQVAAEIEVFNIALESARQDIRRMGDRLAPNLPAEEKALFDAYLRILDSSGLGCEVVDIIKTGQWAQGALKKIITKAYSSI